MATKKQKHAAALEKRERFMAQYRADGLAAQQRAQEERDRQQREIESRWAQQEMENPNIDVRRAIAALLIFGSLDLNERKAFTEG